ncbi:hypothetical protein [Nocardia cyriacigeorgica]|uniref:hypothetical protein n=1 Tax=Nocardia cyriacigeorgica TaxID=135487 RepID=UPI002456E2F2|nr:hypothetical protein [Nocardia cyriacigeorgica]
MNSASQSYPDAERARQLVGDLEQLTARGWRIAAAAWFPSLCAAVTILASVPAGILLDGHGGVGLYWLFAVPLAAVATAWYFTTRRVQLPETRGAVLGLAGLLMIAGTLLLGRILDDALAFAAPWLTIGIGFAVFGVAMRAVGPLLVGLVSLAASIIVSVTDPAHAYSILALAVGGTAALAVFAELVRTDPARV